MKVSKIGIKIPINELETHFILFYGYETESLVQNLVILASF